MTDASELAIEGGVTAPLLPFANADGDEQVVTNELAIGDPVATGIAAPVLAFADADGDEQVVSSELALEGGVTAPFDPFADADGDDQVVTKGNVHIRLQQRNGRKSLSTIQGLDEKIDLQKLTKAFKKEFCCNGCVVENDELGDIIQLQGDQREKVKKFLIDERLASKKRIKVHGI